MVTIDNQAPVGDILNIKCPNCGGPLAFGIESGKWECKYCLSHFAKEEIVKAEVQAGSGEELPQFQQVEGAGNPEADMVSYTCPSCGGSVVANKNTTATFCVYCHNPTIVASKLQGDYKPDLIIPFKKTKEMAVAELQNICKRNPFLPKVFRELAKKGEVAGLYVPYWLYGGDYEARFQASATKVSRWQDSNYAYTKTDTYYVERAGKITVSNLPVDGSKRMNDKIMEGVEPYDYSSLTPFTLEYLSGHLAEGYDTDADACNQRYKERIMPAIEAAAKNTVMGYTDVRIQGFQHSSTSNYVNYALLPVWTVMVPYKGETYSYTMNGQTGKIVGVLPMDKGRILGWLAGVAGAVSLILWSIGVFL